MELYRYARAGNWPVLLGYLLFTGMMAVGYLYNVTFVQLGLVDLGMRYVGLSRAGVAVYMAGLALLTCVIALGTGSRNGRRPLRQRLQIAWGVVATQTVLTALATAVHNPLQFALWIAGCAVTLGIGVPVTFSLMLDLIAVRDRGYVAAVITALAYFAAATITTTWEIEALRTVMLLVMVPGVVAFGVIAWVPLSFIDELAGNRFHPRFAIGRFSQGGRRLPLFLGFMFGVFFIDSLGFLRIIETPSFMEGAWQAAEAAPRLTIGITHIVTALIGGVFYSALGERSLFYWIFGLFAMAHLMYSMELMLGSEGNASLAMPLLYATAVSLYTVVNFAVWADLSTPETIGRNAALGVALSGWTATFISTALAMWWQEAGLSLLMHLRIVNAFALLFFAGMLLALVAPRRDQGRASAEQHRNSKQ
ncbi:MAG: MFS transporter [Anaerolineae bacterium]|nr:MFS transporter [Anaerolineae bacterium]